jgi:VCBS repeat-containing protein
MYTEANNGAVHIYYDNAEYATVLAAAKSAAHSVLTTVFGPYTESNYSAENWTALTGFKAAGDAAIDAATDEAGVASAQTTATAGMAGVKTLAQEPGTLAAQDFGVWDTGTVKGYTAGFGLTDANFTGASVVVKLYAGETLLQTNTAVAGKFDGLTQLSGPFDVYGTFDYAADGYWTNVKSGADKTLLPTKVVATVTLANGKTVTAENTNLTGDPTSIVPVHSEYALSTGSVPTSLRVGDTAPVDVTLAATEVKDVGYGNARVNVAVAGPGQAHLLAKDTNGTEFDVAEIGYWGPTGGFPIAKDYSITTPFTCGFEAAGEYTITLSLVDMADSQKVLASKEIKVNVISLTGIAVKTPPTKVNYIEGQPFESADMEIEAAYSDGSGEPVALADCDISPVGPLAMGTDKITITYKGFKTEQPIHVNAKVVTDIGIKNAPSKTEYVVGETFDPAGLVLIATYNDGSSVDVTKDDSGFSFSPDGALTLADTSVTVSFGGMSAMQGITVLDKGALIITVRDSNGAIFPGIGLTVYSDAALKHQAGSGVSDASAGIVTVSGLDAGTYYILVTSVPAGYHLPNPNVAIDYVVAYGAPTNVTFILPKSEVYAYNSTQLADIKVSAGALAPAFDPETYKYNLKLDEKTGSVTITPKLADSSSKLYIDGRRVTAKKVTLTTGGKDTIKIQVKPKTGKSVYYYIYVSRDKSSNANFSSLRNSRGTMLPAFAPDTTNYTVELANTQSSVAFTLRTADKYARYTMAVNGRRTYSRTVSLKLDETKTLVITVKAQDGTTKNYTITIHRNVSHNADIASIKVSRGMLTPASDAAQTKYSLALTSTQSSVTLAIRLADSTAKYSIKVGGKSSGRTISVSKGTTKEVSIVVTSQAGDVKTYIVDISRAS